VPHAAARRPIVGAAADIAFRAASGAYIKALVPADALLTANGRQE
jgi:hypothetical protein